MASPRPGNKASAGGMREVEMLARGHTRMAVGVLAEIAASTRAPAAARVAAANSLLDRGCGRAPQRVEVVDPLARMGDDALRARIAERLRSIVGDLDAGLEIEGAVSLDAEDAVLADDQDPIPTPAPGVARLTVVGGTDSESDDSDED